jgi:hypothetical protein
MTPVLPPGAIAGPSAWYGRDPATRPDEWIRRFAPTKLAEIDAAVRAFKPSGFPLAK